MLKGSRITAKIDNKYLTRNFLLVISSLRKYVTVFAGGIDQDLLAVLHDETLDDEPKKITT